MYHGHGGRSSPPDRGARPPMTTSEKINLAVQTQARKNLEKTARQRAEFEESEVFQQSGYGDSEDDDDGIVRIPIDNYNNQPYEMREEQQVFKLPQHRRHIQEKERRDRNRVDTTRFCTFPSGPSPIVHYTFNPNSSAPSSSSTTSYPTYASFPSTSARNRAESPSRGRSTSRSSKRRRSRSSSVESGFSRFSTLSDRKRRRIQSKRSRRSSSSSSSDSDRSNYSSVSRASSVRSNKSSSGRTEKYSFLDDDKMPNHTFGSYIITSRKFDKDNYVLGTPKKEISRSKLHVNYILGLQSMRDVFSVMYKEDLASYKNEVIRRTFYEELFKIENRAAKNENMETVFSSKGPIDGFWRLSELPSLLNNLDEHRPVFNEEDANLEELDIEIKRMTKDAKDNSTDVDRLLELFRLQWYKCEKYDSPDKQQVLEYQARTLRTLAEKNKSNMLLRIARCEAEYRAPDDLVEGGIYYIPHLFEEITRNFPHEPLAWQRYMDLVQYNTNVYSDNRMKFVFDKCLDKCHNLLAKTMVSHTVTDLPAFRTFYLATYIRYLKWLMALGHTPVALASIQATMEFNFGLDNANKDLKVRYEELERFWNKKLPRIGDAKAYGAKAMMNQKYEEEDIEALEADDHRQTNTTTVEAVETYLKDPARPDIRKNWVAFERHMADKDARVKRTSFKSSEYYTEDYDVEFGGVRIWDPIPYAITNSDEQIKKTVVTFYASVQYEIFDFVQPLLELLGVKFPHTTGCYTTSEQVVSEWISKDIFKSTKTNFEETPAYTENTCITVGQRMLLFVLQHEHEKAKENPNVLDDRFVKLVLAFVATQVAEKEKTLKLHKLKLKDFKAMMESIYLGDIKHIIETYPVLGDIVGCYFAQQTVSWIEGGHLEHCELEKNNKKRKEDAEIDDLKRIRERLSEKVVNVLDEYPLDDRIRGIFQETKEAHMRFLDQLEGRIRKGENNSRPLNDPTLPFESLQLQLHLLITRSRLYILSKEMHKKIQRKLAMLIMNDSKIVINELEKAKKLWEELDKRMLQLVEMVKEREKNEEVSGVRGFPRASALCESLHFAVSFLFLNQNTVPRRTIHELTMNMLERIKMCKTDQTNWLRGEAERARDLVDIQFMLDTLLAFFAHQAYESKQTYETHYCMDYNRVIAAAADMFPCETKYMKRYAKHCSNNQVQWMKFRRIISNRNEVILEKKVKQYDVTHDRSLLMNALTLIYATKRATERVDSDQAKRVYKELLKVTQKIHDPVIWRMVLKEARGITPWFVKNEAYVRARDKCIWSHNLHLDYIDIVGPVADAVSPADLGKVTLADFGKTIESIANLRTRTFNHRLFMDNYELLEAYNEAGLNNQ